MKQCPQCKNTYSDDNLFCLEDGSPLNDFSGATETPTVFFTPNEMPTQVLPQAPVTNQSFASSAPSGPSKWLYLLLGAMAATILALALAFYYSRTGDNEEKSAKNKEEPANTRSSNAAANTANQNAVKNTAPVSTPAISVPAAQPNISPGGNWAGEWNSTAKTTSTYFTAQVDLVDDGTGKISGKIVWTLRRTTNPKKMGKEGMSATEYVQGTFNPATRALSLKGVRKEDPYGLVILDKYNLVLSPDEQTLSGRSIGGQFVLKR